MHYAERQHLQSITNVKYRTKSAEYLKTARARDIYLGMGERYFGAYLFVFVSDTGFKPPTLLILYLTKTYVIPLYSLVWLVLSLKMCVCEVNRY